MGFSRQENPPFFFLTEYLKAMDKSSGKCSNSQSANKSSDLNHSKNKCAIVTYREQKGHLILWIGSRCAMCLFVSIAPYTAFWGLIWAKKLSSPQCFHPRQRAQVTEQRWISAEGTSKSRSAFSFTSYVTHTHFSKGFIIWLQGHSRRIGVRVAANTKTLKTQPCRTWTHTDAHGHTQIHTNKCLTILRNMVLSTCSHKTHTYLFF